MTRARLALAAALLVPALALAAPDRIEKQRDWFTNTVLLTQEGERVRFFDDVVKDQVVVFSFIFTRCKDACPLLTQKLVRVKEQLGGALPAGVRFVSITVDPDHDGPEQLAAFARKQGAAVPGWTFLAGKKEDVRHVVKRLGQWVEAPEGHSTLFIAGNARTNHWLRLRPDAPPEAVAANVRQLAAEDAPVATAAAGAK